MGKQHGLTTAVTVERGDVEITVSVATPAPVDVYLAVCIVAVEDKGVAALCADTAVEHGLLIGQFAVHQLCPFLG